MCERTGRDEYAGDFAALDISGPTVLTIVNELKEEGVLKEAGGVKINGRKKGKSNCCGKRYKIRSRN